jgi:hypothetical protein
MAQRKVKDEISLFEELDILSGGWRIVPET